jgi:hypothetical protein
MANSSDPSLRALLASAKDDLSRLVKAQAELAQTELKATGRAAGQTGVLFVAALAIAGAAGIFLLITIAYGLVALGLPVWAGFGIVTLVLIIAAVALAALGRRSAARITAPERTIRAIEETKAVLSGEPRGDGAASVDRTH